MGLLREAVDESIEAMSWLTDADKGAVALTKAYAKQIDDVIEDGEAPGSDVTKALYLGPHLINGLRALGGTPDGRAQLDVEEKVKGALSGIRALRKSG